jgi:hypothetical protein
MIPILNQEIIKKIRAAELNGFSRSKLLSLYILQNIFKVAPEQPIYRIFQSDFLKADISHKILTHIKAEPNSWHDPLENPLLQSDSMANLVDDFYALSWTIDRRETLKNWETFSHGRPAIRVKSTPKQLMAAVMDTEDQFYMLHHWIGLVKYSTPNAIASTIKNTDHKEYFDSLGQGLAVSAMHVRDTFADEKEVRLICALQPAPENRKIEIQEIAGISLCRVPFDWNGVIDEITFGPSMGVCDKWTLKRHIKKHRLSCTFKHSDIS